jgi:hypothetical protein
LSADLDAILAVLEDKDENTVVLQIRDSDETVSNLEERGISDDGGDDGGDDDDYGDVDDDDNTENTDTPSQTITGPNFINL